MDTPGKAQSKKGEPYQIAHKEEFNVVTSLDFAGHNIIFPSEIDAIEVSPNIRVDKTRF